ncbi:MAG: membrane-associated protein [Alphaproteobacteria bacterium]|jgi:membrane-associated protein
MKYASILPLSALFALSLIAVLVNFNVIPPGSELLDLMKTSYKEGIYLLIFFIILLESIIYVGFYFPGQFFAVLIVVGANPSAKDIFWLTVAMVAAATVGSVFNYSLGRYTKSNKGLVKDGATNPTKLSRLLIAMIHINSLAFFMFAQGASRKPIKIVALAGLFNLPYYLLLIAGTAVLSEQVMAMAENTYMLFAVISIWLVIALYLDFKKRKVTAAGLNKQSRL